MKHTYKYLFIITILFITLKVTAQESEVKTEEKLSLNSGTIENQFQYIIEKSNKYQDFKVVKKTWLYTLKAHTLDSLKAKQKNLNDSNALIKKQNNEISKLKTDLETVNTTLNTTNEEKDSMSLFGTLMSKASYNVLMWSIIAVLFALLLFFVYKFNSSNTLTKIAKRKLKEVETEFEEHRRVALEREQKVRRQLQDEINKSKS